MILELPTSVFPATAYLEPDALSMPASILEWHQGQFLA
jgi:hypothetical protein